MTKKQYRLNKWGTRLLKNNRPLFDWANEADDIVDLLNELHEEKDYSEKKKCEYWNKFNLTHLDNINLRKENKQLKSEIQQYKALLQDMGLLMSDNEVNDIRNDIADKFLKPLFKMNGFDVDINTDDGFTIIPKGDDGVWVKNK